MSRLYAVVSTGIIPPGNAPQSEKKRYAERLSGQLAIEVAEALRTAGFPNVKPYRGGPGERAFQGGLGPKKVDVSYADEQHGLILAVSIKTITAPPFGKNLKNRFSDLCTEAITLHMRFPYAVVCMLFAFPADADRDVTPKRPISTFARATRLLATISGRAEYTDPGEKFEHVALLLFEPATEGESAPALRLVDAHTGRTLTEDEYFRRLRSTHNARNPHALIGEANLDDDEVL